MVEAWPVTLHVPANTSGQASGSLFCLVSCEVLKLVHESVELFHFPPAFSPPQLTQSALSALIALEPSGDFIKGSERSLLLLDSEDSWRFYFIFSRVSLLCPPPHTHTQVRLLFFSVIMTLISSFSTGLSFAQLLTSDQSPCQRPLTSWSTCDIGMCIWV